MLDSPASFASAHPNLAYWLDECIKIGAVTIGAAWTVWNFRKSRPYAQKPDLQISGDLFFQSGSLFVDVTATLKNLGAAKQALQRAGTYCELIEVRSDLSLRSIRIFEVFTLHDHVEPGETILDHLAWRVDTPSKEIIWLRIDLRAVSARVEWNTTTMVRVTRSTSNPDELSVPEVLT